MDIRRKMKPLLQFGRVRDHVQSTLQRGTSASSPTARTGGATKSGTDSASGSSLGIGSLLSGTDSTESPSPETESPTDSRTGASGNLFQCSTCESVYIADEKETCPTCETDVQQVRSTFAYK